MTTKISHNVNRYLADIVKQLEVLPVTLDGVLSNVKGASPVMLLDASHKSLSYQICIWLVTLALHCGMLYLSRT